MDETSDIRTTESDVAERRRKFRGDLAQLREKALSDLEARGYAVRGKTSSQIRRALRTRPKAKPGSR